MKQKQDVPPFVRECLEGIVAWTVTYKNERQLLQTTREAMVLWNMLVEIDYHRPFHILSMRYMGRIHEVPLIDKLRFSFVGGPIEKLSSYEVYQMPCVELRCMRTSLETAGHQPKVHWGPLDSEIAELTAELKRLEALRQSLVDCAPPHGREYRLAMRRSAAHGMGRYRLRALRSPLGA